MYREHVPRASARATSLAFERGSPEEIDRVYRELVGVGVSLAG